MSWSEGIAALRQDSVIGPLIKKYGIMPQSTQRKYFFVLFDSIVSQQISGKASAAILKRVQKNLGVLTPKKIAAAEREELRELGLSNQKVTYVQDLALKFLDGTIQTKRFSKQSDEEIISELVKVKGIGRWTAQMFLIFSLGRIDVWPVDDYGVRTAIQRTLRKRKLPDRKTMEKIGKRWAPHRTIAALYLWKSLNNQ